MQIRRFRDARSMKWTNGTGTTHELVRYPPEQADFDWRLSIAEVSQDGPFSQLIGIDRTIVFCQGPRMTLNVDGHSVDLEIGEPFQFSGDSRTTCQVPDGSTRDLNVMTNRRTTVAETTKVHVDGNQSVNFSSPESALIALTPGVTLDANPFPSPLEISTFDAVLSCGTARVSLSGIGTLLLVEFRPTSMSTT